MTGNASMPAAAAALAVALAVALASHAGCPPSPARADEASAFDPVTGFRTSRYRAPVPDAPAGSRRVSIYELDRLAAEGAVLVDVMPSEGGGLDPSTGAWRLVRGRDHIPGSTWLPDVGRGAIPAELEDYFRRELARLTAGDAARPVVVYCQSDCWMAWNALRRAAGYGYSRLYWYPEGTDGWRDHDRALVPATPVPLR
jgi:PQQ-dependent catabolism-associated CXXCW motif protein